MGDLFISTDGWSPNTDITNNQVGGAPAGPYAPTSYDYAGGPDAEDWDYVVVFGDRTNEPGDTPDVPAGDVWVYQVLGGTIEMSRANGFTYFRDLQELYYVPDARQQAVGWGTYSVGNDLLSIDITNWEQAFTNLGFHWTMSCGNDVIEGRYSVSEPATMLLLGFGLIGLTVVGRKRFVK
jgi:hypothetical protein